MTNSQEQAFFSSSLLHRFLCSGGLPTHPSSDADNPKEDSTTRSPPTPPGIVARLIGLDSFPNYTNSPKPTIIQKSRSLGSLDFLTNFQYPYHPCLTSSDLVKSDMGLTPIQEKSKSEQVSSVPLRIRRKMQVSGAKKKVGDDEQKYRSRSKRYNHPLPKMKKRSMLKRRKSTEYSEEYCIKVFKEVCRLTRVEIEGGDWNWMDTKVVNSYNLQQVSYAIGQQILHVLLYEMLDELYM